MNTINSEALRLSERLLEIQQLGAQATLREYDMEDRYQDIPGHPSFQQAGRYRVVLTTSVEFTANKAEYSTALAIAIHRLEQALYSRAATALHDILNNCSCSRTRGDLFVVLSKYFGGV